MSLVVTIIVSLFVAVFLRLLLEIVIWFRYRLKLLPIFNRGGDMSSLFPGPFRELIRKHAKHLSETEILQFARQLRQKLLALEELMDKTEVENLRRNIQMAHIMKEDIKEIMSDKTFFHYCAAGSGVASVISLFGVTNPFGIALLGASVAAGFTLSFLNDSLSNQIKRKLENLDNLVERDHKRFCRVAASIRELDDLIRKYFKHSLFDEKSYTFLTSAATHVFVKCKNPKESENRMVQLLKQLALAEACTKLYSAIRGTLAVTSTSALVPILNVALQTVLLMESMEDRNKTMRHISREIDKLQKAYDILKIVT